MLAAVAAAVGRWWFVSPKVQIPPRDRDTSSHPVSAVALDGSHEGSGPSRSVPLPNSSIDVSSASNPWHGLIEAEQFDGSDDDAEALSHSPALPSSPPVFQAQHSPLLIASRNEPETWQADKISNHDKPYYVLRPEIPKPQVAPKKRVTWTATWYAERKEERREVTRANIMDCIIEASASTMCEDDYYGTDHNGEYPNDLAERDFRLDSNDVYTVAAKRGSVVALFNQTRPEYLQIVPRDMVIQRRNMCQILEVGSAKRSAGWAPMTPEDSVHAIFRAAESAP